MNKRQKKKHVKTAVMNIINPDIKISDRDFFVIRTIGTNKRVLRELKTSRIAILFNRFFKEICKAIKPIISGIVEFVRSAIEYFKREGVIG